MDEATIKQIASAIANHLPAPSIGMIVVQLVLIAVAAAAGAFFGEYFKTKGKNLATKQDFEDLKDQLRANTELVERVKAEIGREDWAAREWTNLRRLKLEELLLKANASASDLNQIHHMAIEGKIQLGDGSLEALEMLQMLYLPELRTEVYNLVSSQRTCLQACASLGLLTIKKRNNSALSAEHQVALAEAGKKASETIVPVHALRVAARQLLVKIMKVD